LAAGLATINVLEHSPVYEHIDRLGQQTRDALNTLFEQHAFPARSTGVGSLFAIHLLGNAPIQDARSFANSDHELSRKLFSHLLDNEILMVVPEMLHGAISHAHSDTNIRDLTTAVEKFVTENNGKRSH
jgi:glutamate-1-semialdehyde aminotransferase